MVRHDGARDDRGETKGPRGLANERRHRSKEVLQEERLKGATKILPGELSTLLTKMNPSSTNLKFESAIFTWSETPRSKRASSCCCCCSYVVQTSLLLV